MILSSLRALERAAHRPQTPSHIERLSQPQPSRLVNAGRRLDQIYRVDPVEAPGEPYCFRALLLRHQKPCQPVHNGRRREAEQPVRVAVSLAHCTCLAEQSGPESDRDLDDASRAIDVPQSLTSATRVSTARSMAARPDHGPRRTARRDTRSGASIVWHANQGPPNSSTSTFPFTSI